MSTIARFDLAEASVDGVAVDVVAVVWLSCFRLNISCTVISEVSSRTRARGFLIESGNRLMVAILLVVLPGEVL